ncbi:MAG: DUF2726 domain-containing protein [Clostridia bacterium]|nr:DUF2726 domain-containing protein [Clostridia bacterium]
MPEENIGCLGFVLKLFGLIPKDNIAIDENTKLPYVLRDDFLSPAERSFFQMLQQVISNKAVICPKVSLKDIFFVKTKDNKDFYSYNNKIHLKHVDFLICSKSDLKPVCGIELDDTSHQKEDRVQRDIFVDKVFKDANLQLIRFQNKKSYTMAEIEERLSPIINNEINLNANIASSVLQETDIPICPKCGIPMTLRTSSRGENKGKKFFGCTNYPKCREIMEIQDST